MAEEKEKSQPLAGIMVGLLSDGNGNKYIGIDLMGTRLAMDVDNASVVFTQLGDLLDALGYFDDEGEVEVKGAKKCAMH